MGATVYQPLQSDQEGKQFFATYNDTHKEPIMKHFQWLTTATPVRCAAGFILLTDQNVYDNHIRFALFTLHTNKLYACLLEQTTTLAHSENTLAELLILHERLVVLRLNGWLYGGKNKGSSEFAGRGLFHPDCLDCPALPCPKYLSSANIAAMNKRQKRKYNKQIAAFTQRAMELPDTPFSPSPQNTFLQQIVVAQDEQAFVAQLAEKTEASADPAILHQHSLPIADRLKFARKPGATTLAATDLSILHQPRTRKSSL